MSSWTQQRARIAGLSRDRAYDDPELLDARRELRTLRLAEAIHTAIDGWPPLTEEQRDRLATLLRPVPAITVSSSIGTHNVAG